MASNTEALNYTYERAVLDAIAVTESLHADIGRDKIVEAIRERLLNKGWIKGLFD